METERFQYDNRIVRNFAIASVTFGLIGMLVGLLVALQLVFPALNFDCEFRNPGHLAGSAFPENLTFRFLALGLHFSLSQKGQKPDLYHKRC